MGPVVGPLKSMGPTVIVPPAPLSVALHVIAGQDLHRARPLAL